MTQEAITKLQDYVKRSNVSIADITVSQNNTVKFLLKTSPTEEQLRQMQRELYFVDSTVPIKLSSSAFRYHERVLSISEYTHTVFRGVLSELHQIPSLHIEQVEVSEGELTFYYRMDTRPFLNAQELEKIQQRVDPSIPDHDSIRVFGFKGQYTLYIRFKK